MGAGASSTAPPTAAERRKAALAAKKARGERNFAKFPIELVSGGFHRDVPDVCMLQIEPESLALVSEDAKVGGRNEINLLASCMGETGRQRH